MSDIGRLPTHIGFDGIKGADAFEEIGGERSWLGLMDVEYLAPEVCPAGNLGDAAALVELVICGIGIGLEMAREAGQFGLRMNTTAVGREPIPGERRG